MKKWEPVLRIVLLLLATWLVWTVAYGVGAMLEPGPTQRPLIGLLVALPTVAVLVLLLRLEGRRWRSLDIHSGVAALGAFAAGALAWLAPAGLVAAVLVLADWVRIEAVSGAGPVLATLAWLLPAVLLSEALPEELAFRGYVQGKLERRLAPWLTVLLQALVFTVFAWAIGALASPDAWMFIPGLGVILGMVRALSGSAWTSMGMHAAWMTTTQLLVSQSHFEVANLPMLLFVAFTLSPAIFAGVLFDRLRGGFDWARPEARPEAR